MKMASPGYSMNIKLAAPELLNFRLHTRSLLFCIHKNALTFGKKLYSRWCFIHASKPYLPNNSKKLAWSIRSSSEGAGLDPSTTNNSESGTRLIRAMQAVRIELSTRIKGIRKNFPMKLLFFLVGFYCATVFATVIGQTGDWDILSAALAVAIVEGIGALMYRASLPLFNKVKSLISMFNYWKAGLSLGLFLDSFKYEMQNIGLCNPFKFEIDLFPILY